MIDFILTVMCGKFFWLSVICHTYLAPSVAFESLGLRYMHPTFPPLLLTGSLGVEG